MTDQIPPADPQDLWQNQEPEEMSITLAEVRARANRLHRQASVILISSLIGLVLLVIVPTVFVMQRPRPIPRAIWAIVLLMLFYPNFRSYKAGRVALGHTGTTASVEYYRRELERRVSAPRAIVFFAGAAAWGALSAFEGVRPLTSWIPFFFVLAVWGITYYFTRRHEVQSVKADLEQLRRLIARNSD